jgi:hypothetical protein
MKFLLPPKFGTFWQVNLTTYSFRQCLRFDGAVRSAYKSTVNHIYYDCRAVFSKTKRHAKKFVVDGDDESRS